MSQVLKTFWVVALAAMLSACSAHPKRVDCGGHLVPINAPAPSASGSDTPHSKAAHR